MASIMEYQPKSREYMDKVKQLEKYIEPLRRMITKIGTEDQVGKYLVTTMRVTISITDKLISIMTCDLDDN